MDEIAQASKLKRLLYNPVNYILGILYRYFIYPITKKGKLVYVETFFGATMKIMLPASLDIYIMQCKTHRSEVRLTKFLMQNLKEGDRFLDVGAHFGFFTLLGATLVGAKGKVYSIEAAKETYALLAENVKNLSNVEIFHNAVGNTNTEIEFYEFPILYSEYNAMNKEQYLHQAWFKKSKPVVRKVHQTTLDTFISDDKKLLMIKIDIEGGEFNAIEGGKDFFKNNNCTIITEYVDNENNKGEYVQLLKDMGYDAHFINNTGDLYPVNDIQEEMKKINSDSENLVFTKLKN